MANLMGLYYPYIHFQDDAWLKLTALYWDRMGRIVPGEYGSPHDSDTVRALKDELGFIQDFYPAGEAFVLGRRFLQLLQQYGDALRVHYDLDKRNSWSPDEHTLLTAPPGSDPRLAYVFDKKMDPDFIGALEQTNLATRAAGRGERWMGMHPKLAFVYMNALAEEIAANRGYQPIADDTLNHLAVSGCTLERLAQALLDDVHIIDSKPTKKEIEEGMISVALQYVIPEDIANIPSKTIIKVKQKYAGELAAFQDHVQKLVDEIEKLEVKNNDALESHIQVSYEKNIKPALDDIKGCLGASGITACLGVLGLSVTSSSLLTSLTGLTGFTNPVTIGVGTISLGLFSLIHARRKEVRSTMKSPVAYLLRLEKELTPSTHLSRVTKTASKFFYGV